MEDNIHQEVWDSLKEAWCWHKQGEKVGLSRFMAFVKCSKPYQAIYHTKLLGMIYLGIKEGWLTKDALVRGMKKIQIKINSKCY